MEEDWGEVEVRPRWFIGKEGKYQIPNGSLVFLKKCYAKRKCIIIYNNQEYISMVNLLRKIKVVKWKESK